jgi:hypothetical protein
MLRPVLSAGLLLVLSMACKFNTPTPVPTVAPPASTATPPSTPTLALTPTKVEVSMTVKDEIINCRFGPGTEYILVNELQKGQSAGIIGRNDTSAWYYVRDPGNPNGYCWISADVIVTTGPVLELPVIQPPFVTVTDFTLRVEPKRILVNCSQFPQTVFLEAEITTNGPGLLTWKWEASTGAVSGIGTLVFQEAGTQVINDYYQISGPNQYWVKLTILTPSELVEQVDIPVSCTP